MGRLSLESSQHPHPPYMDLSQKVGDLPRAALRRLRKTIGLPASYDVGVLASQIHKVLVVLKESSPRMPFQVTEAAISIPHLPALYFDDLIDSCEHVGIKYLPFTDFNVPLTFETGATFAGYGFGMCEHLEDVKTCREEQVKMRTWNVLAVPYSQTALTTAANDMRTPMMWMPARNNFSLGYNALGSGLYTDEDAYWKEVHRELRAIWQYPTHYKNPDLVIVTGNAADNPAFRKVLRGAVGSKEPTIVDSDPLLATAKGTADWYLRFTLNYNYKPPVNVRIDL
jgi:hypothetical protein